MQTAVKRQWAVGFWPGKSRAFTRAGPLSIYGKNRKLFFDNLLLVLISEGSDCVFLLQIFLSIHASAQVRSR